MNSAFKLGDDLSDAISILFHCPSDQTFLMTLEGSECWIPTAKISNDITMAKAIGKEVDELFDLKPTISRLLFLNKFWVPNTKCSPAQHLVFEGITTEEVKRKMKISLKYRGKSKWCSEDEVIKYFDNNGLRNIALLDYISAAKNKGRSTLITMPVEFESIGNATEMTNNVLVLNNVAMVEQLVDAAKIDRSAQEVLYAEFLNLCFPSFFMSASVFGKFITDIGWGRDEIIPLFRAADLSRRNGLSFRELLFFLAAAEPGLMHGGGVAELRCRYIFRYFDESKTGKWRPSEFRKFIIYSRKIKKLPLDSPKVDKDFVDSCKMLGLSENSDVTLIEFLQGVSELKLRGTSQMFRAPNNIQAVIRMIQDRATVGHKPKMQSGSQHHGEPIRESPVHDYELAVHTVQLVKDGTSLKVDLLMTFEGAVTLSSTRQAVQSEYMRKLSISTFDVNSSTNGLLKLVRSLAINNKKFSTYGKLQDQPKFVWGQADSLAAAKLVMQLCPQVRAICMREKRLLNLSSPVYIMGDFHGNFNDLLNFEQAFWPSGVSLCPSRLLFLGDYVDRGLFSFEVICYLFAYKLQCPNKLYLLRGNHEIKKIQSQFTFERFFLSIDEGKVFGPPFIYLDEIGIDTLLEGFRELRFKFGDKLGVQVWASINSVFDTLPIAAIIDSKVFCVHGGIPPPWLCPTVSAIEDIPVVLDQPYEQSSLAWELMWNDPIGKEDSISEKGQMELLANEGFANNFRRGTGHIFNSDALNNFLSINNFTHLVRAHEVAEAGFNIKLKGKLLTIFSSSRYCGGQNQISCLLADQNKLRVLRLET